MATSSGLHYMTITNYANGRRQPDVDAMRSICRALPAEEAAALLVARLADECPSEFESLIRLEPRDPTLSAAPIIAYLPELPPKLREALGIIARAAALTKEWQDLVLDLANVAHPLTTQKYPELAHRELLAAEPDQTPYGKPAGLIAHVTTDKARRVLTIDDAFTAICGYTLDEVKGLNLKTLLQRQADSESATTTHIRRAMEANQPVIATLTNYHKNGHTYRCHLDIRPTPEGFTAEIRKIT